MHRWDPDLFFRFARHLPAAMAEVRAGSRLSADQGLNADAIVILGCRLLPGGVASGSLRARAEAGATLFHTGVAPIIVTTGASHEQPPGEAIVAAAILRDHGVPEHAIRMEEKSRNTEGNFAFSRGLCPGPCVYVVTEPFHMARALRIARVHGFDPIPHPVISPAWLRPWDRARLTARDAVSLAWWLGDRAGRPR
ncbi:MAG: YdcF family protein [Myxococcales bacterium]|nr:YdcF family protein [Myxococcales bacterium]